MSNETVYPKNPIHGQIFTCGKTDKKFIYMDSQWTLVNPGYVIIEVTYDNDGNIDSRTKAAFAGADAMTNGGAFIEIFAYTSVRRANEAKRDPGDLFQEISDAGILGSTRVRPAGDMAPNRLAKKLAEMYGYGHRPIFVSADNINALGWAK